MDTTKPKRHFTEAQMLIRRPAEDVFKAFLDPQITSNFWFTKGSGMLSVGHAVTWEWEMYGISTQVTATEILPHALIRFSWGDPARDVEFRFQSSAEGHTYVTVKETGYTEQGDELLAAIKDSMGGFTTVLDGLKAWMEHGINLNLIADKFPKEFVGH